MSNKDFYRAFEDKHRGSREVIKERVKIYLPFVLPLKEIYTKSSALDIGCGRGEWLDLLSENAISGKGIDLDAGMLQACRELNLQVEEGNGLVYLKEQESESMSIISAFHVVEHISFEELQELVEQSLRVLKPGGILILETPNPENIKVATENFYLDPTHIKPIPAALLSFLPEYYGFQRTKVLRLQETKNLLNKKNVNLLDVFGSVSPDYAVVAQKDAPKDILKLFNDAFNQDFGISLIDLSLKFEARFVNLEERATQALERSIQAETKATQAEERAIQAETKATQAEERATQAEEKAAQAEEKASLAETKATQAEERAIQAETKATQAEINYHSLLNSNSWKYTKPLRLTGKFARWFKTGTYHWITFSQTSRPRRVVKKQLITLKHKINANPNLKMKIMKILNHFPSLKNRLKRIGNNHHQEPIATKQTDIPKQLSPKAQEIYRDLKRAIDTQKESKS